MLNTPLIPFIFAILAALAGFLIARKHVASQAIASRVLYAVAAACVVLGVVALTMNS